MTSIQEEIRDVSAAISALPLAEEPFVHGVADRFLPSALYRQLSDAFPDFERTAADPGDVADGDGQRAFERYRHRATVTPATLRSATLPRPMLRFAAIALSNPVVETWIRKFTPAIAAARDGTPWQTHPGGTFEPGVEFVADRTGYELPPHTDGALKLLTALMYVGPDEEDAEIGTCLFEPVVPGTVSDGDQGYTFDSMREVRRVASRGNRCLAFARTPVSFHGVRQVAAGKSRRLVQFSIKYVL